MWSHSGLKCCHCALSSASLCLIPAHHVPPVVFLSLCLLLCAQIGVNHCCFLLCCRCPAVRIHNHTVLPSSHNSSYVYTNDSAYTNISATVGEDQPLLCSLKLIGALATVHCFSYLYLHIVQPFTLANHPQKKKLKSSLPQYCRADSLKHFWKFKTKPKIH